MPSLPYINPEVTGAPNLPTINSGLGPVGAGASPTGSVFPGLAGNPKIGAGGLSALGLDKKQIKNLDPYSRAALEQQQLLQQQLLGTLENYGAGQKGQINQDFQNRFGSLNGNLAARGLASSSLASAGGLGLERERQLSLGSLSDQLLGKRLDVLNSSGNSLTTMLSNISQQQQAAKLQQQQFDYTKQLEQQKFNLEQQKYLNPTNTRRLWGF